MIYRRTEKIPMIAMRVVARGGELGNNWEENDGGGGE